MKIISFLLSLYLFTSCVNTSKRNIEKVVTEWQGKEIVIPEDIHYKILGRDTICDHLWAKPFRVFTYIDSVGCTSCQLQLQEWKELINFCKQQSIDISFVFVVHSSDFTKFTNDVKLYKFKEPIVYDYENQFHQMNKFPPYPYRTFLLNSKNQVQLIGSPIDNPQIWDLYKKVITH